MSKEVKRYSPDTNGRMREWPEGDYATWDDYDALRTELAEANADFVRIANEREALLAQLDSLLDEVTEMDALRDKLSGLLSKTAVALRGPEPELTRYGYADIPLRVKTVIDERDQLSAEVEGLRKERDRFRAEVKSLLDAITAMAEERDRIRVEVEALRSVAREFAGLFSSDEPRHWELYALADAAAMAAKESTHEE